VGVTLSFFCAESPATAGTTALLQKMGVEPAALSSLRYRGNGWPGHFAPVKNGETEPCQKLSYRDSWAFLQAYRPWSVQFWPDGTGELADISCGDPWYEAPDGVNPGFSLVVARTERGREIVEGAIAAGYLIMHSAESWKLEKSQAGLLNKKGAVWGRRLAMRLLGLPVTHFKGLGLFHCWKKLTFSEKLRSTIGTLRRALTRRYRRPLELSRMPSTQLKHLGGVVK
jgi:coenzyme F420 hydrogenase subunit beta